MQKKIESPSLKIASEIHLETAPVEDSARIAAMLLSAFKEDSLTKYLSSKARHAEIAVKENFRMAVERAYINGVVFRTSPLYEGIAVWFLAGFPKSNLYMNLRILRFKLRQFRIRDISKMLPFFLRMEQAHMRIIHRPHYYLELLGVTPQHQGKGFASKLMQPVLAHADKHCKKCYLETETKNNVAMYKHFGFMVVEMIASTFGPETFYLMLRKPKRRE